MTEELASMVETAERQLKWLLYANSEWLLEKGETVASFRLFSATAKSNIPASARRPTIFRTEDIKLVLGITLSLHTQRTEQYAVKEQIADYWNRYWKMCGWHDVIVRRDPTGYLNGRYNKLRMTVSGRRRASLPFNFLVAWENLIDTPGFDEILDANDRIAMLKAEWQIRQNSLHTGQPERGECPDPD